MIGTTSLHYWQAIPFEMDRIIVLLLLADIVLVFVTAVHSHSEQKHIIVQCSNKRSVPIYKDEDVTEHWELCLWGYLTTSVSQSCAELIVSYNYQQSCCTSAADWSCHSNRWSMAGNVRGEASDGVRSCPVQDPEFDDGKGGGQQPNTSTSSSQLLLHIACFPARTRHKYVISESQIRSSWPESIAEKNTRKQQARE